MMTRYRLAGRTLERTIAARFRLPSPIPAEVKRADDVGLVLEARDLMGDPAWARERYPHEVLPAIKVLPTMPTMAYTALMQSFRELAD